MGRLGDISLLATVCNTTPGMAPYALWLAKDDREYLVDLSDWLDPERDIGLTGLTHHDGKIYLAVQTGWNPRILVFDRELTCIATISHPDLTDIHSLCIDNGTLLAVATGTQSVVAIDLANFNPTTLFRTDQKIHVNSALRDPEGLLICCQSPGHLFRGATKGGVIDVSNQRVVVDGLGFPHSLIASGKRFIVLDSDGERLLRFDRNGISQVQALSGFLRGAAAWAGRLFVASSVGRIVSRKHPKPGSGHPAWDALHERVCIHELSEVTLNVRDRHFPLIAGFEIYELLALPGSATIDPPPGHLLTPEPHVLSRAFYEAAKNAAASHH